MTTLALDASSTCTGWSVFEDGKYVKSGYIDLKKDKNSEHRLYEMASKITDLISYFKPHKIILEDTLLLMYLRSRHWLTSLERLNFIVIYMKLK